MSIPHKTHCLDNEHVRHFIDTTIQSIPPAGEAISLTIEDLNVMVHREPDDPRRIVVETRDAHDLSLIKSSTCSHQLHKVRRTAIKACESAFVEGLSRKLDGKAIPTNEPDRDFSDSQLIMTPVQQYEPLPPELTGLIDEFTQTDFENMDLDQFRVMALSQYRLAVRHHFRQPHTFILQLCDSHGNKVMRETQVHSGQIPAALWELTHEAFQYTFMSRN